MSGAGPSVSYEEERAKKQAEAESHVARLIQNQKRSKEIAAQRRAEEAKKHPAAHHEMLFQVLRGLNTPGNFCTWGALPAVLPGLEVPAIGGAVGLPVSEGQAQAIANSFVDGVQGDSGTSLSDSLHLPPSAFVLTNPAWSQVIETLTSQDLKRELGLPEDWEVATQLQGLLVLQEGASLLREAPEEAQPGEPFGRLFVILPSQVEGGELVVQHAGVKEVVTLGVPARFQAHYAAFLCQEDWTCEFQIEPVKKGASLWLEYTLIRENSDVTGNLPQADSETVPSTAPPCQLHVQPQNILAETPTTSQTLRKNSETEPQTLSETQRLPAQAQRTPAQNPQPLHVTNNSHAVASIVEAAVRWEREEAGPQKLVTFLDETYRAEALVSGNLKGKDAAAFDVLRQAVKKGAPLRFFVGMLETTKFLGKELDVSGAKWTSNGHVTKVTRVFDQTGAPAFSKGIQFTTHELLPRDILHLKRDHRCESEVERGGCGYANKTHSYASAGLFLYPERNHWEVTCKYEVGAALKEALVLANKLRHTHSMEAPWLDLKRKLSTLIKYRDPYKEARPRPRLSAEDVAVLPGLVRLVSQADDLALAEALLDSVPSRVDEADWGAETSLCPSVLQCIRTLCARFGWSPLASNLVALTERTFGYDGFRQCLHNVFALVPPGGVAGDQNRAVGAQMVARIAALEHAHLLKESYVSNEKMPKVTEAIAEALRIVGFETWAPVAGLLIPQAVDRSLDKALDTLFRLTVNIAKSPKADGKDWDGQSEYEEYENEDSDDTPPDTVSPHPALSERLPFCKAFAEPILAAYLRKLVAPPPPPKPTRRKRYTGPERQPFRLSNGFQATLLITLHFLGTDAQTLDELVGQILLQERYNEQAVQTLSRWLGADALAVPWFEKLWADCVAKVEKRCAELKPTEEAKDWSLAVAPEGCECPGCERLAQFCRDEMRSGVLVRQVVTQDGEEGLKHLRSVIERCNLPLQIREPSETIKQALVVKEGFSDTYGDYRTACELKLKKEAYEEVCELLQEIRLIRPLAESEEAQQGLKRVTQEGLDIVSSAQVEHNGTESRKRSKLAS